jgi:hypothetical protein
MKNHQTSGNSDLVRVRRSVVNFRANWRQEFDKAGAKRLTFGSEQDMRIVFALPDDHQLLEQFDRACIGLRTRISRMLKSVGRQRAPEMSVPSFVRGCCKVRVIESEPIQQEKLALPQARDFARKCGAEEIRKDWQYVVRRHARTLELLIEIEEGDDKRWRTVPFTEWAVVGCAVPITTSRSRLRSKQWKGRPTAQSQNDAWAEKRQMELICQSGQASLYGGTFVRVAPGYKEEELFPG